MRDGGNKSPSSTLIEDIRSQPASLRACISGRLESGNQTASVRELDNKHGDKSFTDLLRSAGRVVVVASGSSYHAAMFFEYAFESYAKVPVEVDRPGEFRFRDVVWNKGDVLIAITQSGETPDTVASVELAKEHDVAVIALCNDTDSSICKRADCVVGLNAGEEKAALATKTFMAEMALTLLVSLHVAQAAGTVDAKHVAEVCAGLKALPDELERFIPENEHAVKEVAKLYRYAHDFLFMGRGYNFPIALEGAQKVKELAYIHAEGYPAAEMKHGPIALIDKLMPVVMIAMQDSIYLKVKSNIEEVRARGGEVIVVTDAQSDDLADLAAHVIQVPSVLEVLAPMVTVVPMQWLAYHMGVLRGNTVDEPRHLQKVVSGIELS